MNPQLLEPRRRLETAVLEECQTSTKEHWENVFILVRLLCQIWIQTTRDAHHASSEISYETSRNNISFMITYVFGIESYLKREHYTNGI